jgi:uncharacterized integral membrane protein (TIGR00697 family)
MNNLLLVLGIIVVFSLLLLTKKFFGKEGLIGWIAVATILAEIAVAKSVDILGLSATLGNIMFASNFLATDMITESYSEKDAKKSLKLGVWFLIIFLIVTQGMLLFKPNSLDFASDSMATLFGIVPRISIASIVMLIIANYVDIRLYSFLKKKMNDKNMWLRNNLCTILCNGLENFFFTALAFVGVYPFKDIIVISLATTIIETFIAICDTPFLYISKKIKNKNEK